MESFGLGLLRLLKSLCRPPLPILKSFLIGLQCILRRLFQRLDFGLPLLTNRLQPIFLSDRPCLGVVLKLPFSRLSIAVKALLLFALGFAAIWAINRYGGV